MPMAPGALVFGVDSDQCQLSTRLPTAGVIDVPGRWSRATCVPLPQLALYTRCMHGVQRAQYIAPEACGPLRRRTRARWHRAPPPPRGSEDLAKGRHMRALGGRRDIWGTHVARPRR